MRIATTGGRDYADRARVFAVLDRLHAAHGLTEVIHGACCEPGRPNELRGADRWADEWAFEHEIVFRRFHAWWDCDVYAAVEGQPCAGEFFHRGIPHGKAAGPARNTRMIREGAPELLVAFPGGAGTANCVGTAQLYRVPIMPIAAEDW